MTGALLSVSMHFVCGWAVLSQGEVQGTRCLCTSMVYLTGKGCVRKAAEAKERAAAEEKRAKEQQEKEVCT